MERTMTNRVTEGLNNWLDKENQLKTLFGNEVLKERHFLKSKMEFFNDLHKGIKGDANSSEKLLLNIIKGETNKLKKTVYPSLIARVFVKASDFVKEQVNAFKQRQQNIGKDLLSVSIISSVPVTVKTQQQAAKPVDNKVDQSNKELLQQKKQTTLLKVAKDNKNTLNESKTLLPKKRISNNKGQHIH